MGSRAALMTELGQVRAPASPSTTRNLKADCDRRGPYQVPCGVAVAAVNLAIPWSPVAMSELADQFGPVLQATARQISLLVI